MRALRKRDDEARRPRRQRLKHSAVDGTHFRDRRTSGKLITGPYHGNQDAGVVRPWTALSPPSPRLGPRLYSSRRIAHHTDLRQNTQYSFRCRIGRLRVLPAPRPNLQRDRRDSREIDHGSGEAAV